eukprot:Ihof_evm2s368 gene=Ihof_evmTU2s368
MADVPMEVDMEIDDEDDLGPAAAKPTNDTPLASERESTSPSVSTSSLQPNLKETTEAPSMPAAAITPTLPPTDGAHPDVPLATSSSPTPSNESPIVTMTTDNSLPFPTNTTPSVPISPTNPQTSPSLSPPKPSSITTTTQTPLAVTPAVEKAKEKTEGKREKKADRNMANQHHKERSHTHSQPRQNQKSTNGVTPSQGKVIRPSEREYAKDLLCRIKYRNTLPDIPFDAKLLAYPFDPLRFIRYRPSSVEIAHKFDLISESNLNIPIDLIDPDAYHVSANATLHKDDLALLEDIGDMEKSGTKQRKATHHMEVYWLRKTQWISSEHRQYGMTNEQIVEKRQRQKEKANLAEDDIQNEVQAIEKTFTVTNMKKTWKHPTVPTRKALEEMPLLPDFQNWGNVYSAVVFDSDPAAKGVHEPDKLASDTMHHKESLAKQDKRLGLGFLLGMQASKQEHYVGYFAPNDVTLRKREEKKAAGIDLAEDGDSYRYDMVYDYDFKVKTAADTRYEKSYMLMTRNGMMFYNELVSRVVLRKRRMQESLDEKITHANVTYRPFTSEELNTRQQ